MGGAYCRGLHRLGSTTDAAGTPSQPASPAASPSLDGAGAADRTPGSAPHGRVAP
jgi:hypothetical protein